MKLIIRIGIAFILVLVGLQFIPTRTNQNKTAASSDFIRTFTVPENVGQMMVTSCYDCHSNMTDYPWYSKMQPVGWFLEKHINKGKEELNFSEFESYSARKQKSKLKAMVKQIEKNEMPLASYTMIHRDARLSQADKKVLMDYLNTLIE